MAQPHSNTDFRQLRKTPRRIFEHPVGLLHGGRYHVTAGLQLSEGGLYVATGILLEIGDRVVISLILPKLGSFSARGVIIYDRPVAPWPHSYGIELKELQIQEKRLIRNYVSAKTQAEAEKEAEEMDRQNEQRN